MKKYIKLLVLLYATAVQIACESRTIQEIQPAITATTVVSYNNQIKPIIDAKCLGCHNGQSANPNLESYISTKDATQNGDVICRIDNQSCGAVMPQTGRMIQQNIDLIKLWKTQGFLE